MVPLISKITTVPSITNSRRDLLLLSCLFILLTLAGCKKDNENKSKTELLTQSPWIISSTEEKNATGSWIVNSSWTSAPACEKDDITIFRTDNTYETNEGATKCSPSDPQVYETGKWSFEENETKLKVDTDVVSIEELDENTLKIIGSYTFGSSTYHFRATFRH